MHRQLKMDQGEPAARGAGSKCEPNMVQRERLRLERAGSKECSAEQRSSLKPNAHSEESPATASDRSAGVRSIRRTSAGYAQHARGAYKYVLALSSAGVRQIRGLAEEQRDAARCGENQPDAARCSEAQRDLARFSEIWRDAARRSEILRDAATTCSTRMHRVPVRCGAQALHNAFKSAPT